MYVFSSVLAIRTHLRARANKCVSAQGARTRTASGCGCVAANVRSGLSSWLRSLCLESLWPAFETEGVDAEALVSVFRKTPCHMQLANPPKQEIMQIAAGPLAA